MKLSTTLDYSGGFLESVKEVKELESAGLDLVWVAEAYGFDAVSLMGFLTGQTERIEIASGILPIEQQDTRSARNDGRGCRCSVEGPVRARPRGIGTSGDRGVSRSPIRQAPRVTREIIEIAARSGSVKVR